MADQDGDAFAEVLIGMLRRHTITPQAAMASLPGSPGGPETSRPLWYRGTTVVRSGAWHTADVGDLDGDGLHDLMIGLVPSQGTLHNGLALHPGRPQSWDGDQDGAPARDDCDDEDASRGARSPELPADGVDSDCDGRELCPHRSGLRRTRVHRRPLGLLRRRLRRLARAARPPPRRLRRPAVRPIRRRG
jgi:hypothetical protein